ncbi:polysaccharide biosynthesis/export family protein [Polaribacter uvawellassae]|uniref:polysaccharide biosynthesis/export family protein n=1 Tax=Polaribacter uvawellassae TaxID=3133495 RepID=UPI00321B201A
MPYKDLIYLQGEPITKKNIYKLNNEPYRLQVDDVLSIDVKAEDEKYVALFKKSNNVNQTASIINGGFENGATALFGYRIDRHGNIRLPRIGEINVLGYTTKEVRLKLEEEILKYLTDKESFFVSVNLTGIKYTILGEINNPGPKVINQNRVSILDAISNSGDITITGNKKNVELWRNTINGRKKYVLDLTKATIFDSEVFYIQPNDYINVVALKQKSWGTGTTGLQSLTTLVSIFTLVTSTILLVRNL